MDRKLVSGRIFCMPRSVKLHAAETLQFAHSQERDIQDTLTRTAKRKTCAHSGNMRPASIRM